MTMIATRADWQWETVDRNWICYECRGFFPKGTQVLCARRKGNRRKMVCSEECRQRFEDRFWEGKARNRK